MSSLDQVNQGLEQLARRLDDPQLEPDLGRREWGTARAALEGAQTLLETQVLAPLAAAGRASPEVQGTDADAAGQVAATLHAAGNPAIARALFERAARLATSAGQRASFAAAQRDPDAFTRLVHASWLEQRGRHAEATALRQEVLGSSREPALCALAGAPGAAPPMAGPPSRQPAGRPVRSAPPLFRINGFGVALYGSRDERGDGTSITTLCLTALWIPVLPLCAYRVVRDGRRYGFLTHEPLSFFARTVRNALLGALFVAIVWGGVNSWQNSTSHRVSQAIAAARKAEKKRTPAVAGAAWADVIHEWDGRVDAATLAPAADAVVRLALAEVPARFGLTDLDAARRAVARYLGLPDDLHRDPAKKRLADALVAWADALGAADAAHARAGLRLLDELAKVDPDRRDDARRVTLRRGLAAALAPDEPMGALRLYLQNGDDAASCQAALALVEPVAASPSLLLDLDDLVDSWLPAIEKNASLATKATALRAAVDAARQRKADAARARLLAEPEEKALRGAIASAPGDQELVVALAELVAARGDLAGARKLVDGLGKPALLVGSARVLLAQLEREAGELAAADAQLAAWLDWRLAPFQEASERYTTASTQVRQQLVADLQSGKYDAELGPRVEGMSDEQRDEFIRGWLQERVDGDASLAHLRDAWQRHLDVVPASLLLGQLRLERARSAEGGERDALLAGAEAAYLGVQEAAGDAPSYHIGLGQVYYRLGRVADGEKEFAPIAKEGDPDALAGLSETYRDLGVADKARALALRVVDDDKASEGLRNSCAVELAILADDDDEREKWLRRSTNEQAKLDLLSLEAERLLREGKDDAADAKLAEASRGYARTSLHQAASANNLALIEQGRFVTTGELAHVDEAVRLHEHAVRLEPASALSVHNLGNALVYRGALRVLDRYVQVRILRPDRADAATVLAQLADGPHGEEIRGALRQDASVRRGLDMLRRTQTLSPQDPSAYEDELEALGLARDVAGARALLARVTPLEHFSTAERGEGKRRWHAGEMDAVIAREMIAAASRLGRVIAQSSASARTRAAASFLLGRVLERQSIVDHDATLLPRAIEAERQALALAPDLGAGSEVAAGLLLGACEAATQGNDELARAWHDARRHAGASLAAWVVATSAQGPAFLAALRAQPALAEGLALVTDAEPSSFDWTLAWLAGDAAREKAWSTAFDRESSVLDNQARAHIFADDEDTQLAARFFAGRGVR